MSDIGGGVWSRRSGRRAHTGAAPVPAAVLERLAFDDDTDVRWSAATFLRSPLLLRRLAAHPGRDIRDAVACNLATPADALRQLAGDPFKVVRDAVAAHPATPADALTGLACDPSSRVRSFAYNNPSTPLRSKWRLMSDTALRQDAGCWRPVFKPRVAMVLAVAVLLRIGRPRGRATRRLAWSLTPLR